MRLLKRSPQLAAAFAVLSLAVLACDLSLAETIAGSIDTSPTDCSRQTFEVTMFADINDGACNSECSLREAIIASNTCEGDNRIVLQEGNYELSLRGSGPEGGDLDITDSVVIQGGVRPNVSFIEGRSNWNERIFEIHCCARVEMDDLVIGNGHEPNADGGGILNNGHLLLHHVVFRGNQAVSGGALANENYADLSEVDVTTSRATYEYDIDWQGNDTASFTRYFAPGDRGQCGGGIKNNGEILLVEVEVSSNDAAIGAGLCNTEQGRGHIYSSVFTRNGKGLSDESAVLPAVFGGGIANMNLDQSIRVEGGRIQNNRAINGGGLYNAGNTFLAGVEISNNEAPTQLVDPGGEYEIAPFYGSGGGIHFQAGSLIIRDSVVRLNRSDYYGGGIGTSAQGSSEQQRINLVESSLISNTAGVVRGASSDGLGGGLLLDGDVEVNIINTTISGNDSRGRGGAIEVLGGRSLNLIYTTIENNTSSYGGKAIDHVGLEGGDVTMSSSIIGWHDDSACVILVGISFRDYNLVPAEACIRGSGLIGNTLAATTADEIRLEGLTSFRDQWIHPLPPSSWAYDRIPSDECVGYISDQVGQTRPIGDSCDLGAYEMPLQFTQSPIEQASPTSEQADGSGNPTVTNDTLCWQGPGPVYEVVSALEAGTVVEILGRGVEGNWWVIDNPRFSGVRCWAPGASIEVDPGFSYPSTLFEIPPLPTPTPTPILGCLYQPQNENNPVCYPIDECPVDFGDSQGACTP